MCANMKLGIVGCGMVADEHLRALRKVSGIQVAAACDRDEKALERLSGKWNINSRYTDLDKMLDNQDLSMISVLTPPQSHVPIALEAIKRGVHVIVEKPLTTTVEAAQPLMDALAKTHVKLTVDHIMLFSKVMMRAMNLVKEGAVGNVLNAEIAYLVPPNDAMTSNPNHWSHALPGGRIGEMLPHPIYAVQSMAGNELSVDQVVTDKRGDYPWMKHDELKALLRGKEGSGSIYVSFNSPRPATNMTVYGTKAILKIDIINQTIMQLQPKGFSKVDSARDLLGQSGNLFLAVFRNTIDFLGAKAMEYPLRNLYASFMTNVATGTDPIVTAKMAYETVRITEDICKQI